MQIIITTREELQNLIESAIEKALSKEDEKSISLNAAAKRAHIAHATIKKAVESGKLKTNAAGKIPESELKRFLDVMPKRSDRCIL